MQPDTTPDLEEIEACAGLLAAYGAHDSNATMPELLCGAADGARAIREALLLIRQARAEGARAARERDELRDELRRTRNNVGELEEGATQWMQAARSERARAEKAEARAKELEAEREARMKEATAHYRALLSMPETRIPSPEDIEAAKDALREARGLLRVHTGAVQRAAANACDAALAKLEGRS